MISQCDNRKLCLLEHKQNSGAANVHTQAQKNVLRAALVCIVTVENNLLLNRLECDPDTFKTSPDTCS